MHADDLTNQQLLESLSEILGVITDNMATHADIDRLDGRMDKLDGRMGRLERKVESHQKVNIHHHLETRKAIGELNRAAW